MLSPGDNLPDNSLDIVKAIMALEPKFDVEIPDADAEKMRTVQDVLDYIQRKKGDLN